jgi:hypothetical protein
MNMVFCSFSTPLAVAKILAWRIFQYANPHKNMTPAVVTLFLKSADSRENACRFGSGAQLHRMRTP